MRPCENEDSGVGYELWIAKKVGPRSFSQERAKLRIFKLDAQENICETKD